SRAIGGDGLECSTSWLQVDAVKVTLTSASASSSQGLPGSPCKLKRELAEAAWEPLQVEARARSGYPGALASWSASSQWLPGSPCKLERELAVATREPLQVGARARRGYPGALAS